MSNHCSFQSAMLFFRRNFALSLSAFFICSLTPIDQCYLCCKKFINTQIKKFERYFLNIYKLPQKNSNEGVRTYSGKRPVRMRFVEVPFDGIQNFRPTTLPVANLQKVKQKLFKFFF